MNSILSVILTSLSISGILIGAFFALLKKYFLDVDTYNGDKETMRAYVDSLKKEEDKLLEKFAEKFDAVLQGIREEKANAADLADSKLRIEKLDDRITDLTATIEKQAYRLDILIDSRGDLVQTFKELRVELNENLKSVQEDISEVKKTNNKMQLDIQAVKSRLGVDL